MKIPYRVKILQKMTFSGGGTNSMKKGLHEKKLDGKSELYAIRKFASWEMIL